MKAHMHKRGHHGRNAIFGSDHHFSGHHGHGPHHRGPHGHGGGHGGGKHGHRGGRGRLFDYGELRLLVLSLIAEAPAHGYELIKRIEERLAGAYTPSPGVIYPTLSWLVDMAYATVAEEAGGRKRYAISPEGEAFLAANRAAADALLARRAGPETGRHGAPAPILRAMENLKTALRLRIAAGNLDDEGLATIAAAIDEAARAVDRS